MIFYCTICNPYPVNSPSPTANANGHGHGHGAGHHQHGGPIGGSLPVKPVRYHVWLRHLTSREHQEKTLAKYGMRYLSGSHKGYKDSLLEDSNYVVVGISRPTLFPFAIWCSDFGVITEVIHYNKIDCCVVTIQGAGGPTGPGAERAASIEKQTTFQGRLIRVFRAVNMTDNDWNMVNKGYVKDELNQENMRRNAGKNGQPTNVGQTKKGMKTAALSQHPCARSDKENRGDNVDGGPSQEQIGRVGKYGDRKANSPRAQEVKDKVVEAAVCKMGGPSLEPITGVIEEKGLSGNERGSSVGGIPMKERRGKNKRQRYLLVDIHRGMTFPTLLPSSTTGINENCEVPKPVETEHSDEAHATAPEQNELSELVEQAKTIEGPSVEISLVDREAGKVDVVEEKVDTEKNDIPREEGDGKDEQADAETKSVDERKENVAVVEEKVDTEKNEVHREQEKVDVKDEHALVEEKSVERGEEKVDVLEEKAAVIEEKSTVVKEKATAMEAKVTVMEGEVAVVQEKATVMEGEAAVVQEKATVMEGEAAVVQEKAVVLEEIVVVVEEKAVAIEEKVDTEENKIRRDEEVNVKDKHEPVEEKCFEGGKEKADSVEEKKDAEENKIFRKEEKVDVQIEQAQTEEKKKSVEEEKEQADVVEKIDAEEIKVRHEEDKVAEVKRVCRQVEEKNAKAEEKNDDVEEGEEDFDFMEYAMYWRRF